MRPSHLRSHLVRLATGVLFGLAVAASPLPSVGTGVAVGGTDAGIPVAFAQGGMDVGILTPGFSALPLSVQPGEQFVVSATTAPGAQCVGTLQFRDHPVIDLEGQAAPAGACSWTVTAPPTVRPSTGIVRIDVSRNAQTWALTGTLWVSVVGEARR